jgi:hypothetical protein
MSLHLRRLASAAALLAVTLAMPVAANSPVPSIPAPTPVPRPTPGADTSPGGLGWTPVTLELRDDHWLTDLTDWAGGFAALESDDEDVLFALWTSHDGATWARAPLPDSVGSGRLVALGDDLYLQEFRGRGDSQELRIRTWRTRDGRDWQRQGLFEWRLPRWVGDDRMIVVTDVVAASDRLVMFGDVGPCCGTGGGVPLGSKYASILTAVYPERVPLRGLVIWTSPDGAEWRRQSNADLREPVSGNAWVTDVTGTPEGVLATRGSTEVGLFTSPDGSRWESMGPLPFGYKRGPSLGLVTADDRVIVSFDAEGPSGNTLEIWLRHADGSWSRSLQDSYMILKDMVATAQVVVAAAQGTDAGIETLPIVLVSSDGGATWAPDPSFSGQAGSCARDLATDGTRLVLLGCDEGTPTLWTADVPEPGTT